MGQCKKKKTILHFLYQLAICTQPLKQSHSRQFSLHECSVHTVVGVCYSSGFCDRHLRKGWRALVWRGGGKKGWAHYSDFYCLSECREELCIWMCPALYICLEVERFKHLTLFFFPVTKTFIFSRVGFFSWARVLNGVMFLLYFTLVFCCSLIFSCCQFWFVPDSLGFQLTVLLTIAFFILTSQNQNNE